MANTPLVLLGTVHHDPDGEHALTALLEARAPRCITVELSAYAVAFRTAEGARLGALLEALLPEVAARLKRPLEAVYDDPRVDVIRQTLELPFEYTTSLRYGEAHRVPVVLIDDDGRSRARLERLEPELFTVEALAARLEEPAEQLPRATRALMQYNLARRYLRDAGYFPYHYRSEEIEDLEARAASMAERIEALWKDLEPIEAAPDAEPDGAATGGLAHVGGWEQLVRTPKIALLISRLAALAPSTVLVG